MSCLCGGEDKEGEGEVLSCRDYAGVEGESCDESITGGAGNKRVVVPYECGFLEFISPGFV